MRWTNSARGAGARGAGRVLGPGQARPRQGAVGLGLREGGPKASKGLRRTGVTHSILFVSFFGFLLLWVIIGFLFVLSVEHLSFSLHHTTLLSDLTCTAHIPTYSHCIIYPVALVLASRSPCRCTAAALCFVCLLSSCRCFVCLVHLSSVSRSTYTFLRARVSLSISRFPTVCSTPIRFDSPHHIPTIKKERQPTST